jgi:hypothetical protein
MRREDLIDAFKRIPELMHPYANLVMRNQMVLSVDAIARFEPNYLVMRGREGGTNDEGRAFFVPYDEIAYLRVEQVLKLGDLKRMYGEAYVDAEDKFVQQAEAEAAEQAAADSEADGKAAVAVTPPPVSVSNDPASIAKQNLLDRIRAARANATGATGNLGKK